MNVKESLKGKTHQEAGPDHRPRLRRGQSPPASAASRPSRPLMASPPLGRTMSEIYNGTNYTFRL